MGFREVESVAQHPTAGKRQWRPHPGVSSFRAVYADFLTCTRGREGGRQAPTPEGLIQAKEKASVTNGPLGRLLGSPWLSRGSARRVHIFSLNESRIICTKVQTFSWVETLSKKGPWEMSFERTLIL